MKKVSILVAFVFAALWSANAQTISELNCQKHASIDTSAQSVDLMISFSCTQPEAIDVITIKLGSSAGASDTKLATVKVLEENGNYYTQNGLQVYKVSNGVVYARLSKLTNALLPGKYISVQVAFKNGDQSSILNKQIQ